MIVPPHLLAAIRQPAFVYRREGIIDAANDLAIAWAGGPLAGMTLAEVIACLSARHRDGTLVSTSSLPAARALRGEEVVDVPLRVVTADGRTAHVLATASPIREGETIAGALTIWQDVTAGVLAEEGERRQRARAERLAHEIEVDAEELRTQQEELRVQEEELRAQADELREQGAALRVSLDRLAFAQTAARTGFWDRDMATDRLEWSPGFYDLFALDPRAPASFETWLGALHPQDREEAMATIDRAVREKSRLENEYRVLLPDGTVRWIGAIGDTTYDADGRPVRMAGICVDITERVLADEALRRAQLHYQALLEHSLLSYTRCRTLFDDAGVPNDYEFVEVNEAYLAMTGFSGIVGRRITEVIPGMERDLIDFHNEVALGGSPRQTDVYSSPLDRWYQVNVYSPAPGEFVALSRDISARKRMEAALAESEARFRLALANAPTAIFSQDRDLRYTWVSNPAPAVADAGLVGKTDAEVLSPEDAAPITALKREVLATGESRRGEVSVTADGTTTYYDLAVEPVTNADGKVTGVMGVSHEITERKRSEADRQRFTEELRRSNQELQRFAYVASHDLQEPLRSIVSFSQLLERRYRGRLDSDADEYIDFIVEGGMRMQRMIQDLLQLSRVETGARPLEPTDAGAVVVAALASLDTALAEAGATVTVGPMPRVQADAAQLEQVFANLIGNALKYRREGVTPEIAVSAGRRDGTVEFSVADNGIGIEPEYYDRIFEMFRRLHTHDRYEGSGIGLAVVKRIVERHGGTVRVESVPGEGSTFFFTLPAV